VIEKSGKTLVAVPHAVKNKSKHDEANKKEALQPSTKRILTEKAQKKRDQEREEPALNAQQNELVSQVIIGGSFSFYGKHTTIPLSL
jgi:hypothetical protein